MDDRPTEQIAGPQRAAVELRLFVVGHAPSSARARTELERLRPEIERAGGRLDVVDVLERPELAEEARIIATPVLVRLRPPPRRSLVGDLSDLRKVAEVLELGLERRASPGETTGRVS